MTKQTNTTTSTMENKVKMVELLTKHNVSTSQIAEDLGISERTVIRYRKRARENTPTRKPIAKSVVTPANIKRAKRLFTSNPNMSKRKVARAMRKEGIKISETSALNCAKMAGIKKFSLRRKPPLGQQTKKKRVLFATKHGHRHWKNVLFVDETAIELIGPPNHQNEGQWAESIDEVGYIPKVKHPLKLNVFAGVAWSGKTKLVFYSGKLNGTRYASILDDVLPEMTDAIFKKRKWMLIQDASPLHLTREVMDVLKVHGVIVQPRGAWPGYSPDLNPIENIWAIVKDRVGARKPANKAELMHYAVEEWQNLPQETVQKCILSLRNRMALVLKNKGGHTGK